MVEVFRTNVKERFHADLLLEQIHKSFPTYKANFDLEDCDKILRIKSESGMVQPMPVILLLNESGFHAEPLPDEPSAVFSRPTLSGRISADQNILFNRLEAPFSEPGNLPNFL